MANISIFKDFKPADVFQNKYRRRQGLFQIWDANTHHGDIRPFACPTRVCEDTPKYDKLFHLSECSCLGFPDNRDIVQGFCHNQYFFIENGQLKQATTDELCAGSDCCLVGSPIQPVAPHASASCGSSCEGVVTSYVVTYLTQHAGIVIEGSPSPPSNPVVMDGTSPNATVTWSPPPNGYCVVGVRLYRVTTTFDDDKVSPTSSEFALVGEFNTSVTTFWDDVATVDLGQPLLTYSPVKYPAPDNLVSLARTADGIAVADEHRVYISLSGEPMFTADGVVEVEDTIRHIEAVNNTLFVLTDRHPVKIGYRLSEVIQIDRHVIKRNLPLASKKSVSTYNGRIFFASEYSLYVWDTGRYGSDTKSLLNSLITPEQWKNLNPSSVIGVAHEYGYILSSDKIDYSLMIEVSGDGTDTINATSLMPISYINPHVFGLDNAGHIMYQEDNNVYRWDYRRDVCSEFDINDHVRPRACEQCECCSWEVKVYFDNEGKNHFSHMRVEWDERSADHLDISFHVHEFGREIDRTDMMEIVSSRGFGLPYYNISYQSCYAKISGCGIMHEVRFATSANELVYNSNAAVEV